MSPTEPFFSYSEWLKHRFSGKLQKLPIDAGFTCPNRDGTKATGGCVFCNNKAFNTSYCDSSHSISRQIENGKKFYADKYPDMRYLAYFQAYSNTYAPVEVLRQRFEEALAAEDVVGIIIATRPDCVNEEKLDYIGTLSTRSFVMMEYGIESTFDSTLRRINRGHDFACTVNAMNETARRRIITCGHTILGLPGEDEHMMLEQARALSQLPIDVLKIHQLQIIRGTTLANEFSSGLVAYPFADVEAYINLLVSFIRRLRPTIALERFVSQCPNGLLIAPKWGVKNQLFNQRLKENMQRNGYRQGDLYDSQMKG